MFLVELCNGREITLDSGYWLGTLPNHPGVSGEIDPNSSNVSGKISVPGFSPVSAYQKLGSPELKPLPPLPRNNFKSKNRNSEAGASSVGHEEEDDDVFFSPRGSSLGHENSPGDEPLRNLSSSRREHPATVGVDRFGSRSFNSRTASYPFSNSGSSRNTASNSPSPPLISSPLSIKSSSPEVMILKFPAPSRPPPPPPLQNGSPDGPNAFSLSPSSSARVSDVSMGKMESSVISEDVPIPKKFVPKKLPPPPPPVPPPRFWERPRAVQDPVKGPPVLAEPSRPVVFQDPEAGHVQTNGIFGGNEDNPRPKLKPLHWDKVRASSDRAMVWDQLKSSSFQ